MSLYTINYRGLYINNHCDGTFSCTLCPTIKVKSLHAAKLLVTKILRNIKGYNVPLKALTY